MITSDGEHQEGNTWEAVMFAGKQKLNNLIVVIDRNKIQRAIKTLVRCSGKKLNS